MTEKTLTSDDAGELAKQAEEVVISDAEPAVDQAGRSEIPSISDRYGRRERGVLGTRAGRSEIPRSPIGKDKASRRYTSGSARTGLLIDWGGVLTSNLFASFHAYCLQAEIDPQALAGRFKADPQFRELLIALEKGDLEETAFESRFAALLEVEPDGLIDGLFAGVGPDVEMIEAVRRAHKAGIRTALVSNSWGVHRYPHDLFSELFDGVVISGEEGMRKPSRRMYELGAERAGVPAGACVYVDDLPFNLTPAEELGMATIHHTSAETTIPELERLLGIALRSTAASNNDGS
ncbi:MAG TPA: HAD family phosphatase [Solirubrobacteraceae bacterium]|jgi:putative hydrolase of the HAD superfamily|nr:HAD family phosphatase [Solirubrobacteraceae bacterium]